MDIAVALRKFSSGRIGSTEELRARLHAWWEGYELPSDGTPSGVTKPGPSSEHLLDDLAGTENDVPFIDPAVVWSAERRELVQLLWGDGFIWPGGTGYVYDLVNAFALTPAQSMLELGAGLGGGTRAVVDKFGTYVTGREANEILAGDAMEMSEIQSVGDKAQITPFDPKKPELKIRYYEAALVREALYTLPDKAGTLNDFIAALKPEGQIVITDYLYDGNSDDPHLKRWLEAEPVPVYPWTDAAYKIAFGSANVVVRICEDQTDAYRAMALNGWNDFLPKMKTEEITDKLIEPLLQEAEMWTRRLAAMESGALRYYRIVGIKNSV